MPQFKRVFLIVLDSVGIGEAPDAEKFGDSGANTLGHIAEFVQGLHMPNMEKLGLSNIKKIKGIAQTDRPKAHYAKMQEASFGKDTLTGHWELMGLHIAVPFRTFPNGFDDDLILELERRTGRRIIGNKRASGTQIITELGENHLKTGALIVYTSADSVLQIAAHEEIVPIEELYAICEIAREITKRAEYMVGRVIARPFIGKRGNFHRTANRHDYALKPFGKTVLDELQSAQFDVIALGKITDIFAGEGITKSIKTKSNEDGMTQFLKNQDTAFTGLIFINLVDFDALYGHRRDPVGYAKALEVFDEQLPQVLEKLTNDDLLLITADHGNDPTHHGTDHTREFVPLLAYHHQIQVGKSLGMRETFADVGATIAENFHLPPPPNGVSFLNQM